MSIFKETVSCTVQWTLVHAALW